MIYRAILIVPDAEPAWIGLDGGDVNADLRSLVGGGCDFSTLARDPDGRGVQIAVGEWSLSDGSPHNTLASEIVHGLGRDWCVHGTAVLLGLRGPATVDLTDDQWTIVTGIGRTVVATAMPDTTGPLAPSAVSS